MDQTAAAGAAVRTGQPVVEGEVPSLFQAAMEGCHGPASGLTAVKMAGGQILIEPDVVERVSV